MRLLRNHQHGSATHADKPRPSPSFTWNPPWDLPSGAGSSAPLASAGQLSSFLPSLAPPPQAGGGASLPYVCEIHSWTFGVAVPNEYNESMIKLNLSTNDTDRWQSMHHDQEMLAHYGCDTDLIKVP